MEEEELVNSSPVNNSSPGPIPKRSKATPVVKDDKFISKFFTGKPRTEYNTPLGNIGSEMSSTFHGQNTGVGQSTFDEGLLWGTDIDNNNVQESLNEYRYNQQGWGLQVGAGIARAGTKAATEILKLPGVVIGGIAAPFAAEGEGYDTAFNNQWIKAIDNINENINTEILPVYVGKAIKEGNLWDNITSTSFWATDGADGLGFMIGMMAPGAMINKIGVGAKLVNAAGKTAKALRMTESLETGINGLSKIGFQGAQSIDMGLGVAANTIFEAGAEAKSVGDTMDAQKDIFIANYPNQQLKKLQELDFRRRRGEITIDEYNQLSAEISNKTAEESFKEQRAQAMADNFKMNLAILLGPNLLMHQAIWGKAAKKVESEVAKESIKSRVSKSAKRWGEAFLSEGFLEEGGQSTSETLFIEKAMRGELTPNGSFINDFSVGELTNGYLDMVSSNEGQKAIFLGGVMGGPMMSYQGRKEDINNRKETNAILERTNNAINSFNTIFNNDIYKKKKDGSFVYKTDELGNEDTTQKIYDPKKIQELALANHFTEQRAAEFEQAVKEGNSDIVNEIKQQAVFDLILPSIYNINGGLDVMKQQLEASQEFQEIIARDNIPSSTEKSSNFVNEILDAVKNLQFQQEKFDNFSKDIIELNDSRANEQDKESYLNKLSIQYLKTKFSQYNAEKDLKILKKQREDLLDDLDLPTNLVTEDETLINAEKENSLLKIINDNIRDKEQIISKNKKDVSELWQGKDLINKSFSNYIDQQLNEEERLSDENVAKAQKVIDDIDNSENKDVLQEVKKQAEKEKLDNNPLIKEKLQNKEDDLNQKEEFKQEELEEENESLARDKREEIQMGLDMSEVFGEPESETISEKSKKNEDEFIRWDDFKVDRGTELFRRSTSEEEHFFNTQFTSLGKIVAFKTDKHNGLEAVKLDSGKWLNNGSWYDTYIKNNIQDEQSEKTVNEDLVEAENDAIQDNNIDQEYISPELEETLIKTPTNDVILDGNPSLTIDNEIPASGEEVSNKIDKLLKTQQTGVKLISTIRDKKSKSNGQKLEFISQNFIDYERNGQDKINTPVGFRFGTYNQGNSGKALKLINDKSPKSAKELETLYNYLPIEIFIPINEDTEVNSFIETKPFEGSSKEANKIFESEILPLRKLIVDSILSGSDINKLTSHIVKQFPGVLQVDPQILLENGKTITPQNSIEDLQFFKNFKGNVLAEISKRTFFVDYDGQLTSVNDRLNKKGDQHKGIGEIFLEIPQNNGKPFMLKLNYKAVDENKGSALFEVFKVLSTLTPTVENPSVQSMLITDFLNQIDSDVRLEVEDGLREEIKLVNDLYENSADRTLDKLITYVIHQDSTNARTKLKMNKNGHLLLGDLSPISRITKNELLSNDPQYKEIFTNFVNRKRHNVLITKDGQANFQNPIYLKYLLDNNVLSTNAVVNQPTFQGYSNIYISNNIKGIGRTINEEIPTDLNNTQLNTTVTENTVQVDETVQKSEEDQAMELLDKFEDWNLDISLIDTTQSPSDIINQVSNIVSDNEALVKEFKKICGL